MCGRGNFFFNVKSDSRQGTSSSPRALGISPPLLEAEMKFRAAVASVAAYERGNRMSSEMLDYNEDGRFTGE